MDGDLMPVVMIDEVRSVAGNGELRLVEVAAQGHALTLCLMPTTAAELSLALMQAGGEDRVGFEAHAAVLEETDEGQPMITFSFGRGSVFSILLSPEAAASVAGLMPGSTIVQ